MLTRRFRKLLCRVGHHDWKIDTWIPIGANGKVITRYRCPYCGQTRNVWQRWPSATRQLEQS